MLAGRVVDGVPIRVADMGAMSSVRYITVELNDRKDSASLARVPSLSDGSRYAMLSLRPKPEHTQHLLQMCTIRGHKCNRELVIGAPPEHGSG